ncbi:hypothetical protein PGT21_002030 [Puccinia graminis f. sp. tritici]|uniref:Purple acid phosphatase n=2 Tax=Puccinia graminis f. sp. tritici TaxID=56615 RepID=E3KLI7_PUCGT|nr:uncharacterized protein PGTG_11331 [Puccinia graminis f. sp. tritici CRL 75-36-700-3]EFP85162.1 hypothetical protein PGTG_11331 [Puccinia graminis f. sp. tritici CRL 75-36-700-3]KAA1064411.1 hypothetical protein PGT21_002030 [Puccinia graminis f. sp. tritici]
MLRTSPSNSKRNSSYFRSNSPPTLPGYNNNSNSHRRRKLSRLIPTHSASIRPIILLILLILLIYWASNTLLILFRFKIADGLLSAGWIGIGLKIRKPPLIFIHSSQSAAVVWESNKMASSSGHQLGLRYWAIGQGYKNQTASPSSTQERLLKLTTGKIATNIRRTRPEGDNGWRRWVHTALLEELEPGTTYVYEIVLLNSHFNNNNQHHDTNNQFEMIKKTYSKHRFTWHGIDPIDLNHGHHRISETSATSRSPSDVLHIVVIGDNQFAVKTFRKLVKRFINIKAYLPSPKSIFSPRQLINHPLPIPNKPNMIFHLGDAVQDAHNLKQWQTDFWDPLTFKNKLASEIPIVYAKGNHDFDNSGHNLYSGGLPKVQIGEMNRTQTANLNSNSPLEIPGIAEADKSYTTFTAHERDPQARGTYFAYSPHPRVRVIVCDSNLEPTRKLSPQSSLSEVDEHERWLLWEMARPEWKEASIRIILVHVPPFIEFWEKQMWNQGHESAWGSYVRTRFAPHFHGLSPLTSRYDIPPASMVISGHSHMYARGMLSNFVAGQYFGETNSAGIPVELKKMARTQNKQVYDPVNPQMDHGVVYVISGGAGGVLDSERVEEWGFYERTVLGQFHFNHLQLDMSQTLSSVEEWNQDWDDSRNKRRAFKEKKVRVYKLIGSQLVCQGPTDLRHSSDDDPQHKNSQVWEAGHYSATDRLVWSTRASDGRLLDRFVIEADSCR